MLVAAGALLGWTLPRWERHLPEAGLTFDASTAQATLVAIAGGMITLLADIAIRALSPAVNDPTTAVQALDQVEDALLRLAGRPLGPVWLLDKAGRPRVHSPAPQWGDLVSLALDETLLHGSANPQIVRRLHALFDRLLAVTGEDRREPVAERRQALERLAATRLPDPLLRGVATRSDPHGLGGAAPDGG